MTKYQLSFILFFSINAYSFETTDEASKILMPFKKEMMKTLKTSMKNGGVKAAVGTCQLKAPAIAKSHTNDTISVGRTSLKYRNEINQPEKWMEPILREYESTKSKEAKIVQVGKDRYYLEPIYLKGLCLNCHGTLSASVKKTISASYPSDKAHNYKVGDFRGLFWVRSKE